MDPVKRKTIVSEIERWRSSKLLPEHYCDFLLNLYIEQEVSNRKGQHFSTSGTGRTIWKSFLIFSLISFILVCSLYFTSFHPTMQIGFSLSIIGILFGIGIKKRQNNPSISYILVGIASIILLFIGEFILRINEWNSAPIVMGMLAFCGALWIIIGITVRIGLMHFCGWVCMIMVYTWLIQWLHPEPNWYVLQLYAIPVFAILFLLGRKQLIKDRIAGWLFMIIASLFFIIPEIYGLLFSDVSQFILIPSVIFKIVGLVIIIWYVTRNPKMKEWVTG